VSNSSAHVLWTEHAACQWNGQAHVLSAMNRRHAWPRGIMLGSARWLKPHAVCHVERGAGVYADRSGTHQTRSGHVSAPDPRLGPIQGPSMFCPETLGPHCGRPGPHMGGPDPIPGVRLAHVEALDQPWRSELYIQGSGTLPWWSELTFEALGYITFSRHVADPDRLCGGVRRCCGPRVVARGWGESWLGPTHSTFTTRKR
jgi:hypothetical protein